MTTKFIIAAIRIVATVLFYFLLIVTVVFLIKGIFIIFSTEGSTFNNSGDSSFDFQVIDLAKNKDTSGYIYSGNKLVRYVKMTNSYTVQVLPQSAFGYYQLATKIIFLLLGMAVLWNFKKIFSELKLAQPFNRNIIRRLKWLAFLFIVADIIKFINYLLTNSYMQQSFSSSQLKIVTEDGNGLVTGLIIWVIAIIYERGIVLQEENALTV